MYDRSDSLDLLAQALSKVQAKLKPAIKDQTNPFFRSKYADLSSVWDACRGLLAENGISVIQSGAKIDVEGIVALETTLLHTSGQFVSGITMMKPTKNDPQGVGSCISYARRYALASMVGVVTEDDDAEGAVDRRPISRTDPEQYANKPVESRVQQIISVVDKVLVNPKGGFIIEAGDKYHTPAKAFAEIAKKLGQEGCFAEIKFIDNGTFLELVNIRKPEEQIKE